MNTEFNAKKPRNDCKFNFQRKYHGRKTHNHEN